MTDDASSEFIYVSKIVGYGDIHQLLNIQSFFTRAKGNTIVLDTSQVRGAVVDVQCYFGDPYHASGNFAVMYNNGPPLLLSGKNREIAVFAKQEHTERQKLICRTLRKQNLLFFLRGKQIAIIFFGQSIPDETIVTVHISTLVYSIDMHREDGGVELHDLETTTAPLTWGCELDDYDSADDSDTDSGSDTDSDSDNVSASHI
jgi:hypothetical protein